MTHSNERVAQASKLFLDKISDEGIYTLVRTASEFFDAPVLVTDHLFHIRNLWPRYEIGIEEVEKSIQNGCLVAEEQWAILDENLSGKETYYKPFYSDKGRCKKCPRIFGELVWEKEVRGHVIVFLGSTAIQEGDLEIVEKLTSLLVLKGIKNKSGLDTWTATLQAKMEVLLDPMTPHHVKKPAIELLSREIKSGYGIMVTQIGSRPSQMAFADYAVMQIQQKFRNIVALRYDNAIVTLFGEVQYTQIVNGLRAENNQLVKWLFNYFEKYDLISGVSDYFTDVSELNLHYRRALLTTRYNEKVNSTKHGLFEDCMPLPMLGVVIEHEDPRTFMHPGLKQILEYDKQNNTDFFRSLYVYVMMVFDKEEAAKHLCIHKNTLVYRLGRIAELINCDLNDRKVRLNLMLSCALWYISEAPDESWNLYK